MLQNKSVVWTLLKQRQFFWRVWIIMVIIVICLLMEKKYVSLKLMIKMLNVNLIYDKFGSIIQ